MPTNDRAIIGASNVTRGWEPQVSAVNAQSRAIRNMFSGIRRAIDMLWQDLLDEAAINRGVCDRQ